MTKLILANWKMNLGLAESLQLAKDYQVQFAGFKKALVGACVSDFALPGLAKILKGSPVKFGAQNCFWVEQGAYTGEISPKTLVEIGCSYVLLGHSERRQYLNESCRLVNLKLKAVLAHPTLTPVVCVGESLAKRQAGEHLNFVTGQIKRAFAGVAFSENLVVAYEPIWAIGTGVSATAKDAAEMHQAIRSALTNLYKDSASQIKILYGGSVNASNAQEFLTTPGVDGLLVGGASLKAKDFYKIAKSV